MISDHLISLIFTVSSVAYCTVINRKLYSNHVQYISTVVQSVHVQYVLLSTEHITS